MTGGPLDGIKWYHVPLLLAAVVISAPVIAAKSAASKLKQLVKR
jgi:hypothetical protein